MIESPAPHNTQTSNILELSVSELSAQLKRSIEDKFDRVRVRGELGRVVVARSGHIYFDIKDEKAVLASVMWKGVAAQLSIKPEEGLQVIAEGRLSIYPGQSKYQLIADSLHPDGAGALMALLEARKKKLAAEGLFAAERKKALPAFPQTIGVVTSPSGAVIRDILHRIRERFPLHIILWPCLVQGEKAAAEISAGIRGFNAISPDADIPRPDLIIVARGGGAIEDLWAFNEEEVVRAAADSHIPLISAIGHETDTVLLDYVADLRAPTPTGAAEMAVPVRTEWLAGLDQYQAKLQQALLRKLDLARADFRAKSARLPRPLSLIVSKQQNFDFLEARFGQALQLGLERKVTYLQKLSAALRPQVLQRDIARYLQRLDEIRLRNNQNLMRYIRDIKMRWEPLAQRFNRSIFDQIQQKVQKLKIPSVLLHSLSHKSVIERGFVLVRKADGTLMRKASEAETGQNLELHMQDGELGVTVNTLVNPPTEPPTKSASTQNPQKSASTHAQIKPKAKTKNPTPQKDDPAQGGQSGQGQLF